MLAPLRGLSGPCLNSMPCQPASLFGLRLSSLLPSSTTSTLLPHPRRPPRRRSTAILGSNTLQTTHSTTPPASFLEPRTSSAPLRPQFQLTSRTTSSKFYLAYTSRKLDLDPSTPSPPILPYVSKIPPTTSPTCDPPVSRLQAYRSLS